MMPRNARYRLVMDGICFICRRPVTYDGSIIHGELMILTHKGGCTERVNSLRRIHDRSSRGRWRPIGQLLQMLEEP